MRCYFPNHERPERQHPGLVLSVHETIDEKNNVDTYLLVAAGCSYVKGGAIRAVREWELLCEKGDPSFKAAVLDSTKFSFAPDDLHLLPYTTDWFHIPNGKMTPVAGEIDLDAAPIKKRLEEIQGACGFHQVMEDIVAGFMDDPEEDRADPEPDFA